MAISNISSRYRLTGMYSGFDTETMVSNLMKLEQLKYDRKWKSMAKLQLKQDALTEMQNKVRDFRNDYFSQISKTNSSMLSRSTFLSYTTTVDDKNNALDAKAVNSNAADVVVNRIVSLAKGATANSSEAVSRNGQGLKLTDKLRNLTFEAGMGEDLEFNSDGKISFSINGQQFTFSGEDTLQTVINTVNGNTKANVTMSYSTATDKLTVTNKTTGENALMYLTDDNGGNFFQMFNVRRGQFSGTNAEMVINEKLVDATGANVKSAGAAASSLLDLDTKLTDLALHSQFTLGQATGNYITINGVDIQIDANDTLRDVIDRVNNDSTVDVTMSYSLRNNTLSVVNKKTGASEVMSLSSGTTNFFSAFNIVDGDYNGVDARMQGTTVVQTTNNFVLDGIEYNLKKTTEEAITITSQLNVDGILDSIKAFVEGYNKFVVDIQSKLNEKVYKGFDPLTDEERAELKESEAKLWDEKAKSGLMRNDSDLKTLLSQTRSILYEPVGGTGKLMCNIGITTAQYMTGDNYGTLVIDEDVLRAAIMANPEEIADMFTNTSTSTDSATKSKETGYAQKFYDLMNTYTNKTVSDTYYNYSESIRKMESNLETMLDKLYDKQEALYAKFSAMETALSKLSSQSDWITSQLSSLSS